MQQISKPINIKLIYLKQIPNRKYNMFHNVLHEDVTNQQHHRHPYEANRHSIALLSSILQDQRSDNNDQEQTYENQQLERHAKTSLKPYIMKPYIMDTHKTNVRNLSTMINSDAKVNNKVLRSKTEGIDKLLNQKKIMPINQLKQGTKNIHFSTQNKKDFNADFSNFIQRKEATSDPYDKIKQKNTVISRKRSYRQHKRQTKVNESRKMRDNYPQQSQNMGQHEALSFVLKNKRLSKEQSILSDGELNYGWLMMKMKKGVPHLKKKFQWSKLHEQENKYVLN